MCCLCVYVHVCVYVCGGVCIYVYVCAYVYVCVYVCMCVCVGGDIDIAWCVVVAPPRSGGLRASPG